MQVKDAQSGEIPSVPSAHAVRLRPQCNPDRASCNTTLILLKTSNPRLHWAGVAHKLCARSRQALRDAPPHTLTVKFLG